MNDVVISGDHIEIADRIQALGMKGLGAKLRLSSKIISDEENTYSTRSLSVFTADNATTGIHVKSDDTFIISAQECVSAGRMGEGGGGIFVACLLFVDICSFVHQ